MTDPMLAKLVRFQRPEQMLPFARNLSPKTLAGIFGTEEADFRGCLDDFARQRTAAAARIVAEPSTSSSLRDTPLKPGAHVVAVGESTTADRLSWFEILRTLLETHRPDLRLRFTNLAVSGATTTQTLATLPGIRHQAADWLFCMLGTNDSRRCATSGGPLLVSPDETRRNLTELRARALPNRDAAWVWVTPPPVDEGRVAAFPFFADSGVRWWNDDLDALVRTLPTRNDLVIDSSAAVSRADPDAFAEDGLHPSAAAQEALAARVLVALASEETR